MLRSNGPSKFARPRTSRVLASLVVGVLLLSFPQSPTGVQAASGLVAAYSFDEGVGTSVGDASGFGNVGSTGTATWTTQGRNGNALSFNGSSARVTVPDAPSLRLTTAMTLEAWVNPSSTASVWRDVIFKGDDNYFLMSSSHAAQPAAGGIFSGTNSYTLGPATLPVNTWTHLATTYDGTTLRLYVNGTQVASKAQTGTLAGSSNPMNIGGDTIYNQYFAGRIDDVRIYNSALTASEVQVDMNTPVGGGGPADTTPPTAPTNLSATAISASQLRLTWTAATDNVGVIAYRVERCQGAGCTSFAEIATAGTNEHTDTGRAANTTYRYRVRATDPAGNLGPYSGIASATTPATDPFANETVAQSLDFVTTMRFLPDGKKLVGEIGGTLRIIPVGANQPSQTPFNVISGAVAQADAGLHDLTLDPNFASNGFYYVHYAHTQGASYRDRLSRFTAAPGWTSTVAGSEVVLWQDDAATTTGSHHGASVGFGPDGKLYLSMGDNGAPGDSQSLTNYHGKMLRFNPDGTVPSDNPFIDGPGGNKDEIWAYGLRNPYRLSFDSVTGNLYVGDVGGNDHGTAWEEVNIIRRGANYGWPLCEGQCSISGVTGPIYTYPHAGRDAAIMGGFVYRGTAYPAAFRGSYFFADYAHNTIKRLALDSTGTIVTGVFDFEPADGSRDNVAVGDPVWLQEGPDGALYYLDLSFDEQSSSFNAGTLRRIRYLGSGNQPPSVVANGAPLQGQSPLTVDFSSAGTSDPEGDALTYLWAFGDGTTSAAANPSHTYASSGRYGVTLTVSDGSNAPFASLTVVVGTAPAGQILTPSNGALFVAGDHIAISGDGTDADDGVLPNSAFSWTLTFHHEGHQHPVIGPIAGRNFTFDIPTSGHDFSGFTRYEVILTVTDSDGLTHRSSVFIFPDKVSLSFDTVPSGLTLILDGISKVTPFVVEDVKGFAHTIDAPQQVVGGTSYAFASWSDGGAKSHGIMVPTTNQSYVATFQVAAGPAPVAAYSFNEGVGTTVADASGTGNAGSIGTATWTTQGRNGNALTFNGTTARVTVPDAPSLRLTTAMTLEAWVFPTTSSGAWRDVVFKGDDNYFLMSSTTAARPAAGGIFSGVNAFISGPTTLPVNTWTHLATTYDGTTLRLYVNGTQVASVARTGTLATSTNPLNVGGDTIYSQYFAGRIDDVRVYNTALTASQVQADMNTPVGGSTPPDTTAPTAPTNLTATAVNATQINLAWTAATDNVAVTGYRIERCQGTGCTTFTEIATPTTTTYNDTGRTANTTYRYQLRATDAAGNLGPYTAIITTTTPAVPPAAGLVAAYSFNAGTGTTVADASGTGNTGSVGTATWTTQGRNGNALSFNGTSARVTVPDSPSLRLTTAMTLEAWVFPTARSNVWRDVIFKGDDNYFLMSSTHFGARPSTGGIFSGTNAYISGNASLPVNTWTHLAATYDGTTLRLYVNGAQVASSARTGTLATSANPLNIGGDAIYGQYFAGRIDDVRIYNTARTAAQVQSDMATAVTP